MKDLNVQFLNFVLSLHAKTGSIMESVYDEMPEVQAR